MTRGYWILALVFCTALVVACVGLRPAPEPGALSWVEQPASGGWSEKVIRCESAASGQPVDADLLLNGFPAECRSDSLLRLWWRGGPSVWIEGTALCPVSPCGYLPFSGDVPWQDTDVDDDPGDDVRAAEPREPPQVGIVRFQARPAR